MKRKIISFIIVFVLVFIGLNISKVSAYKCVYSGGKMDTSNWLRKAEGELTINISSASSVRADFTKFETDDNEWFEKILSIGSSLGGSGSQVSSALQFMKGYLDDEPLDSIAMIKDTKSNKKKYISTMSGYNKQMADAVKNKRCPSTVNITYATCNPGPVIFYNFNSDIWDWFELKDDIYKFYVNDKIGSNDTTITSCNYKEKAETDTVVWQLDEKKTKNKSVNLMFACKKLSNYLTANENKSKSVKKYWDKYKSCVDKNKNNKLKCKSYKDKYEAKLLEVRTWCNSVIDNRAYNSSCLQGCVDLNDSLYNIQCVKKTNNKEVDICVKKETNCNLSSEIIAFIYNILKWLKYIAPVLVIILGILDFIKALAAQDDDAMKKAQGRFVKRLIAAALLFLLPLIIDYILNIFNLYDSSCDVTEIFK
jgi:hypothetical protein